MQSHGPYVMGTVWKKKSRNLQKLTGSLGALQVLFKEILQEVPEEQAKRLIDGYHQGKLSNCASVSPALERIANAHSVGDCLTTKSGAVCRKPLAEFNKPRL